jgi:Fe-S-cluster-containing dehydrogenase component
MSQYYLFQDTKKCIGCHACEVQCKANKNLPIGPGCARLFRWGPR